MDELARLKYLSWVLRVFGVISIAGVFLMMNVLDVESWTWEPRQSEYEQMIMGIYAVLGVFLLLAARNPLQHRSLIQFTAWSSLVHGGIMLVQALVDDGERANLVGDVPALILIGIVLWWLLPREKALVEAPSIGDR
ncbi:MAG: hypothetical protein OEO77_09535 [Acidimicrobiia bacterium]|nr:hypothetical protein [Acidimicrobiia bacterium]